MRLLKPVPHLALSVTVATLALASGASATTGPFRYFHHEPLNNLTLTPGATFPVSAATICRSGYSTRVRNVSRVTKNQVYQRYGVTHHTTGQYEIDHLISLELGGSNALSNLWPELNDHPHGYLNSKDILENRLHQLVCSGALSLRRAQRLIATNWVIAYHQFVGVWPAASVTPPTTTSGGSQLLGSVTRLVVPGGYETLSVDAKKSSESCSLRVTLPSGRTSTASGLGPTSTNSSGVATWTWRIGSTTDAGTAQFHVTCDSGSLAGSFTIGS